MKSIYVFIIRIPMVILGIYLTGCFSKQPEKTGHEGKPLPSFKLLLLDSTTYFDTKDIPKDKPVVLFYFGPHCPYSRAQMEEIIEDINILKDIRFYFFTTWSFAEMKAFYKHYQLNKYSNIIMGQDYMNFFVEYFEAQGVPYMAIYGKDKILRKAFIGRIFGKQIKEVTEK
jgi:thiol-disulfide isomerase/thioredoxin